MDIAFKILGRTRLRIAGEFVADWGKPKDRAVLAVLLLHSNRPLSVNTIAEWVWPERRPNNLHPALQTTMSRIRSALRRTGVAATIVNEDRAYRLAVDRSLIDFFVFQDLVRRARKDTAKSDFESASALVEQAMALWEEEPLADLDSRPARNWRRVVVRDDYLSAAGCLLGALGQLREHERALTLLNEIQPDHDLDLTLARHRLRALYGLDRREDAVNYYFDVRRRIQGQIADGSEEELKRFHEELRAQYEQPAASANNVSGPRYLPNDVVMFTGRDKLLSQLDSLVLPRPSPRLIALDGLPGVGKTALAVHWAHRVAHHFPDGCWFVNLPQPETGEIVKELLGALGTVVDSIPSPHARTARLRELLATRRMLLVIDNVADADHVRPLLPAMSNCVVLLTGRSRHSALAVRDGAHCLTVEPLEEGESVAWLTDRLGDRASAAPRALARLAALAGGMPLAMTLLGEHLAAQPRRSLDDFVGSLTGGALLSLGGNGIRAAFELSYRALPPEQAHLFRLLGLHPVRDVSLDVVAALAGVPRETARSLADELVWTRLVDAIDGDRYRMHDLLREYAAERAGQDEDPAGRDAAVHRMHAWYLHTVNHADRRVFGYRKAVPMLPLPPGVSPRDFADEDEVARWFAAEKASLVGVVRHGGLPAYSWRLANGAGELMMRYSLHDEIVAMMTVGAVAARATGDTDAEIDTLNNLGYFVLHRLHDHELTERIVRQALEVYHRERMHDPDMLAVLLRNQAECMQGVHNVPRALAVYAEALTLARGVSEDTEAGILHRMGVTCHRGNRLGEAALHLYQALHLRERTGDHKGQADTLLEIGRLVHARGDHFGAMSHCHQAIGLFQLAHETVGQARACVLLGLVNRDRGDLGTAGQYATRALELSRGLDREVEATALDVLAQIRWKSGELDEAMRRWQEAFAAFRDIGDRRADGIAAQLDELSLRVRPDLPGSRERSELGGHPAHPWPGRME